MKTTELTRTKTYESSDDKSEFFSRMLRISKKIGATAVAALAFSLPIQENVAHADDPVKRPIAWTGIGIYPRESPSMESGRVGVALSDGSEVAIACETYGQPVDNGYMTTDLWERLPDGSYLPNAFIDTGTSGYTPGVQLCSDIDNSESKELAIVGDDEPLLKGVFFSKDNPTSLTVRLFNHFLDASGADVVIDWRFLSESPGFKEWLKQAESRPAFSDVYTPNLATDVDLVDSIGSFGVKKWDNGCYTIKNEYDFYPDKPENYPFLWLDTMNVAGKAKDFTIEASSCYKE